MEFQDFPMFLGKSGKYEIHPPKLCAGIDRTTASGIATVPAGALACEPAWDPVKLISLDTPRERGRSEREPNLRNGKAVKEYTFGHF